MDQPNGRASNFAESALRYHAKNLSFQWNTWAEFRTSFDAEFLPLHSETLALYTLEGNDYWQGAKTIDVYIDEFETLARKSGQGAHRRCA